ncbi:hypothetical protein [Actinomadura sp. 21ATH]|uniref:hypothetical protein n=1 Tax=Actinomadura sp. 21ATH TaxID=1735444 RepID=UPI0035C121F5
MDPNSLRKVIASLIASFEGNSFQAFCDRLASELYPGDYQRVRPGGRHGDTKNDGYCPQARIFFAAHATRGEAATKTKRKIKSDLEGCIAQHRDMRVWRYLTNDTLIGEVDAFVDNELRPTYPGLTIEVWDHERLAEEIGKLKVAQIEKILDVLIRSDGLFFKGEAANRPMRVVPDPDQPKGMMLRELTTGLDVWNVVANAHQYKFGHPGDGTDDELDELSVIYDQIKDWGEVAGDLLSMIHQRDAQRNLSKLLERAKEAGFILFGAQERMLLTGGAYATPSPWIRAIIDALRVGEVEKLKRSRAGASRSGENELDQQDM